MTARRVALAFLLALPAACCTRIPAPAGRVVAHVAGHGVSAVLRRSARGPGNYQYVLTVRHDGRVVFRSPGDRARLIPRLTRPQGAPHWFPLQTARLAGIAVLGGTPFVVMAEHNTGADCGSGKVGLIGPRGQLVTIENGCALDVAIEPGHLVLTGPYYGPDAPMVNPTIPHATARLAIEEGRLRLVPPYFRITPAARN